LRPVGGGRGFFSFVFGGSSGGLGRDSKASFASPSTDGSGSGDFGGEGLRCFRCATASNSATRSFSFAIVSTSCESCERSVESSSRCRAFSS